MTAPTSFAELKETIDGALEGIDALAKGAADHFREAVAGAEIHGEAIAAQHLRNRLLAYVDGKGFHHQLDVGLKPRMRSNISILVERLERALLRHFELPKRTQTATEGGKRVLLLIDHLPPRGRMFAHTRQVCTYAAALALNPGVEAVCVMASQETAPENPFLAATELGPEHELGWRAEIEELAGAPVPKVRFITPERVGPVRPYARSVAAVRDFDPDIVFDHQGIFRARLLPLLLHPRAAMVAVQMNQVNPEPPYADLVLAHGYSTDFSAKPTPAKWRSHKVPLIPFPRESSIAPSELGPDSPLRIVTVLTLGRLETGLMRDDAAGLKFVIAFLEEHLQAVWLLVAIEDPEAFAQVIAPYLPPGIADRIRLLPVVSDLRAIYQHCQIYMHLPTLGGGNMGMAMAVAEGIPVLAREGTDAANILWPDQVYRGPGHGAQVLRRLAADPEVRAQRVARQKRKLAREHSLQAVSESFQPLLADAVAKFHARSDRDQASSSIDLTEMRRRYDHRVKWISEAISKEISIDFDANPFRSLKQGIAVACIGGRTGSYYLAEQMLRHGAVITEGFLETRIFNICKRNHLSGLQDYCERHLEENAVNGIFGFKGGFGSLATLILAGEFPARIEAWKFVHLSREDTLKQAISFVIAKESKSWRSFEAIKKDLTDDDFDPAAIAQEMGSIANQGRVWEEVFQLFGIDPLRILYEDLAADPAGVTATVAAYVGLDGPPITDPRFFANPAMERQASELNERWEARFLEEQSKCPATARSL
ncbi:MAG: Stf0 family sulfotransferase [Pseudomonadota bacterium]|nr:Stf0 family sulfotransferase [Pseudomonadota bacterium]